MARLVIALLAMALPLGCVSVRPIGNGEAPVLASGEGILVVHLDSALPIKQIQISQATIGSNLSKGEHFYLVAIRAGTYRWRGITIPAGEGDVPFRMGHHDDWKFRVEAGRINYPGQIIVRGKTRAKSVDISGGPRNRSALALRILREKFPQVLERYPPIYSGSTRDDYLEYYGKTFLTRDDPVADAGAR